MNNIANFSFVLMLMLMYGLLFLFDSTPKERKNPSLPPKERKGGLGGLNPMG